MYTSANIKIEGITFYLCFKVKAHSTIKDLADLNNEQNERGFIFTLEEDEYSFPLSEYLPAQFYFFIESDKSRFRYDHRITASPLAMRICKECVNEIIKQDFRYLEAEYRGPDWGKMIRDSNQEK